MFTNQDVAHMAEFTPSILDYPQCQAFVLHEEDPVLQAADAMLAEIEQEDEAALDNSVTPKSFQLRFNSVHLRNLINS